MGRFIFISLALFILMYSCQKNITQEEIDFVKSRAWVRLDPEGGIVARFYFDTLTGPSFYLKSDSLYLYDGTLQGVIVSVDTDEELVTLKSPTGSKKSTYKVTNRLPVFSE